MSDHGRLLKVNNRHGLFQGDVDKVEIVLQAFEEVGNTRNSNESRYLMQSYMNEAGGPTRYDDVTNRVELAIMIADITPHKETFEEYRLLANYEALRG
jgi:hypothetical protein